MLPTSSLASQADVLFHNPIRRIAIRIKFANSCALFLLLQSFVFLSSLSFNSIPVLSDQGSFVFVGVKLYDNSLVPETP